MYFVAPVWICLPRCELEPTVTVFSHQLAKSAAVFSDGFALMFLSINLVCFGLLFSGALVRYTVLLVK